MALKVLVTGSNGLLGQKLINKLSKDNDVDLIAISRGDNRSKETAYYQYFPVDITDKKSLSDLIRWLKPDCIINTAALTNVDACETQRDECWNVNVVAVTNLAKLSKELGIHLIHLSTDFIFDGESGPYSEEDLPSPLSYYGHSKYESEKEVQRIAPENWSIIRTIIVYGVIENASRSNIVLWAKQALSKNEPIKVVNDQFRAPTLAEDLADACISCAKLKANGIFNISGPETFSVLELVNRVAKFWNLPTESITAISSKSLNQAAKRPPRTGFDISKAKAILGYNPKTFEQGLAVLEEQLSKKQTTLS